MNQIATNLSVSSPIFGDKSEADLENYFSRLGSNEFSSKYNEGYGDEYNMSVCSHPYAKNIGINEIINICCIPPGGLLLDVFGGSGQINQTLESSIGYNEKFNLITADIEVDQISKAINMGYKSIALDASNMEIIADNYFDVVLFAYGFHHLPPDKRLDALQEGVRVTRGGGRVVLCEGMMGGITQKLSYNIVDLLGSNPHEYEHPTLQDIRMYIRDLSIKNSQEYNIFDPHIIVGDNKSDVESLFTEYYKNHYSLPDELAFADLREIVSAIYYEHLFSKWEITGLSRRQNWINGMPYEFDFYVGPIDDLVMEQLTPANGELFRDKWIAVVPRYSKMFVLEVLD